MRHLFIIAVLLAPPLAAAQDAPSPQASAEERIKALEERLEKLEGAPAKTSLSAFNPAMGMAMDMIYSHSDGRGGFIFRSAELNVEAPIDPFLKGWAVITGTTGNVPTTAGGTPTVDIEEATLETTSLPQNLTVRGGRLFADFGRLAHFHDHELPVVFRPNSLNNFIGGETRADGTEVSYLFPTDTYVNATAGLYNQMGTNNTRQDSTLPRTLYEFTYMGRLHTYKDLNDNHSIDLGVDEAWTPKRFVTDTAGAGGATTGINTRKNTWRTLTGVDLTYRYVPVQGGLYHGVIWGTEVLQNNERRFNTATNLPTDRVRSYAGFSYIQVKMGTKWRPGVMFDATENMDAARAITKTYTAFLTYDVTEFQRLRVAYSRATNNVPGMLRSDTVSLQWTGVLGHHVHGFRDR